MEEKTLKFLYDSITKATDRITELEQAVQVMAYGLGKITVCKTVKEAQDIAMETIKDAKS